MKFRSHFGYDVQKASDEATVKQDPVSLTVQSMAEDADINVMMRRYGITGKMPESPRVPVYGDFSHVTDFQSALNAVMEAQDGFMELPADLRAKFENDPQKLLEFMEDSRNLDKAIEYGLLSEKAVKDRQAYLDSDQKARHAELLAAAKAAGLELAPVAPAQPAAPAAAPSKT